MPCLVRGKLGDAQLWNLFTNTTKRKKISLGHKVIRQYNDNSLEQYLAEGGENRENFLFLMNILEMLAIGLDSKIYDEKMVMEAFDEELCHIYDKANPLIWHIRGKDSLAFVHIESLVSKLKKRRNPANWWRLG